MNEASLGSDPASSHTSHQDSVNTPDSYEDQTDRMDSQHAHEENQSTLSERVVAAQDLLLGQPSEAREEQPKPARPSLDALRDTIEAQFSLEVLLKHRELRLIDQEIAKCQVALEQLRRCHVIPYPAMSSAWEDMQVVVNGTGRTQENNAPDAPPWGVTTGPYTRHYRQWLIPDSTFGDRVAEEPSASRPPTFSERSIRASTAGKSNQAAQARAQRGAGSARLKALPHGYPEPREDKGPMIVKRSTDGQMVRLVCLDCRRSDFNSAQGFINHCRIAHSRNFQSHDAAAVACGEEVELDQAGGIVGETSTAVNSGAGLVHPLIRSAHVAKAAAPTPPMKLPKRELSNALVETPSKRSSRDTPDQRTPTQSTGSSILPSQGSTALSFRPSPQTPYLSAFFARNLRGGDLEEEVNSAKTKIDIDNAMLSDDDAEDDVEEEVLQPLSGPASHSTRGVVRPDHYPSRAVMSPAQVDHSPCAKPPKAGSWKPKDLKNPAPRPPHPMHDGAASPNLSPNTVESHQAPSLVSDDDEYENTHSECSSSADLAEDLEHHYFGLDFDNHNDAAMEEDLETAGSSAGAKHLGLGAGPKAAHPPQPTSAMRSPDAVGSPAVNDNRHVSFASPLRRSRKKGTK
ncbi:MAG: hypothetical protein LQ338_001084 [Usnochroma carphineum]|nr:MAG: hypothetical protein LQ338_001084 [Usnochroma carphineum]